MVLGEHGADVGVSVPHFGRKTPFKSKQGAASLLQETAEAALDNRKVKGAGGGRRELQGGEEGFYFPPDP